MSSLAAKIVIVLGIAWMAVVVVLPLVVEAVLLQRTKKEERALSARTKALQLAVIFFAGIVSLMPGQVRYAALNSQREVTENLRGIYTAQVAYYGESNTYAGRKGFDATGCFADLKWTPEGDTRYTYFCGGDRILPTAPSYRSMPNPYDPDSNWPFAIKPSSSKNHFTVMATTRGSRCERGFEAWMINDAGELKCLTDNNAWTFSKSILIVYIDLICHGVSATVAFYPWLIMSALAPFLFLSLRADWRYCRWLRRTPALAEKKKQEASDEGSGPGSGS